MATPNRTGTLQVSDEQGVSPERQLAETALDPLFGGAIVTSSFGKLITGEIDLTALYQALHDRAKAVRDNKLASAEDMLTAQAAALNAMFLELARRSGANMGEYMQAAETYMRLALKAQAQCRATLETLATIKNPPVVYARQANIANGPQQVNNGAPLPRASNSGSSPNGLLETEHGKRLEPGAAGTTIGSDPALEALGAVDGSANGGRQGTRKPQRRQRRKAAGAQD
ncbi:hypothetical protein [Sphingomonas sp. BK345]|uniref:hypothetical protein n=1 Tax=Sphingomonas sp. BK345 TaxID=2586980 RepID=UPI0016155278|nr:hypothetical protein [Sphingomonas sp. BK345]MBB3474260.1 hypothetical protein [Sphingomonas sp. BK345]